MNEHYFLYFFIAVVLAFAVSLPLAFTFGVDVGMKVGSGGVRGVFGVIRGSSGTAAAGFGYVPGVAPGHGAGSGPQFLPDSEEKLLVDEQVERYMGQFLNKVQAAPGRGAVGNFVDPELAGRTPSFVGGADE